MGDTESSKAQEAVLLNPQLLEDRMQAPTQQVRLMQRASVLRIPSDADR